MSPLAVTLVGAFAIEIGVTLFDALLVAPVHALVLALTANVYEIPLTSHVRVIGDDPPVVKTIPVLDVTM